jgi:hypothetical protein
LHRPNLRGYFVGCLRGLAGQRFDLVGDNGKAGIMVDVSPSATFRIAAVIAVIGLTMLRPSSTISPATSSKARPAMIPIWRTLDQKIAWTSSR